jgi:hypothetical protein
LVVGHKVGVTTCHTTGAAVVGYYKDVLVQVYEGRAGSRWYRAWCRKDGLPRQGRGCGGEHMDVLVQVRAGRLG